MGHGPGDTAVLYPDKRRGIGEHAIRESRITPVFYSFGIKGGHIEIQHEGIAGRSQVPAVPELFSVWTVRLNTEEVADKGPSSHFLNVVN